jgi:hypothetical protein
LTPTHRHLVLVSYYEPRTSEHLRQLLESLRSFDAGLPYDVCVVVNREGAGPLRLPVEAPVRILERENKGMNIGAWDHGWRACPGYDGYLFLQDECYAIRPGWLAAFSSKADEERVGLVGETWNEKWRQEWDHLRKLWMPHRLPGHVIAGRPANRVDVYLDFMQRNGIPPGKDGRHLRSLVWYARRHVLEQMDGFPIGQNYGECIAAEIGVSKRVQALELKAVQVSSEPFRYFRHREWLLDPRSQKFIQHRVS